LKRSDFRVNALSKRSFGAAGEKEKKRSKQKEKRKKEKGRKRTICAANNVEGFHGTASFTDTQHLRRKHQLASATGS